MAPSARVVAVHDDVVTIEVLRSQGEQPSGLMKNEVIYILPELGVGQEIRLKAEVLRVRGDRADAQVFEDTRGVAVGALVEQTGIMLSAALGPGLLGQVYDGLQNPLEWLAAEHGLFLPRGVEGDSLNEKKMWAFSSTVRAGDTVKAGDILGHVQESRFVHKVMVPFDWPGRAEVVWIQEGQFSVNQAVAALRDRFGREQPITMTQRWPVRKALASKLLQRGYSERLYPQEPLVTTTRIIDTLFPVARGGTACIPGPFGAGKTVLQHLLSRFSDVDIVLVVACGERAGEVVETITEFPSLRDPRSGGSLMDRTIILCNTSSMPVAARESSIYMGVTLGEYYRQMGLHVLMLADSTSRWAQAMRETSGRLEEIPGEEAFPAYLDSAIRGVYERAGVLRTNDGSTGSLTIIGTVSPAGGNFEEPVTQSTLRTVKTFLGLSADRAYKRAYPAIDPLLSWSRYLDQMEAWYTRELGPEWVPRVKQLLALLKQGESVRQMMLVTGEEGISLNDAVTYHKALFLDRVYLQQDAFDAVDASVPLARQKYALSLMMRFLDKSYTFEDKTQIADFFTRLTGLFKDFNYAPDGSTEYEDITAQILALVH